MELREVADSFGLFSYNKKSFLTPVIFLMAEALTTDALAGAMTKLAYLAVQRGKQVFGLTHKQVSTQVMNWVAPVERSEPNRLSQAQLDFLQQQLEGLMEKDWADAQQGVYPLEVLFDNPWEDFLRYYPMVVLDVPKIWDRAMNKRFQDFGTEVKTDGYPSYYVQNFHHQTDGYFSDLSANMYDIQVEILFNGSADAMRRRVLAPLKGELERIRAALGDGKPALQPLKVLDVACGTGRTLRMVRTMVPDATLYGVDLSAAYLRKANQVLSEGGAAVGVPQLMQANAEHLPYVENYFEAVMSVFLFHELPPDVRKAVIAECFRVLKPGGALVLCDSIQAADTPEFAPMLENFPATFHEPYYRHYIHDDISGHLESAGFELVEVFSCFMSKYWVARKS
jgi:ubiquinone/menaquinone biosynthesis C-methylase UbiE